MPSYDDRISYAHKIRAITLAAGTWISFCSSRRFSSTWQIPDNKKKGAEEQRFIHYLIDLIHVTAWYCRYAIYPEEAQRLRVHEARELGEENKLLVESVNIPWRGSEEGGGVENSTLIGLI